MASLPATLVQKAQVHVANGGNPRVTTNVASFLEIAASALQLPAKPKKVETALKPSTETALKESIKTSEVHKKQLGSRYFNYALKCKHSNLVTAGHSWLQRVLVAEAKIQT